MRTRGIAKDKRTLENADVLNELLALYPYVEDWRAGKTTKKLKSDIRKLAGTYGPPYGYRENTLDTWVWLISRVQAATHTLKVLCDVGYVEMKGYLEGRRSEIVQLGTPLANGRVQFDAALDAEVGTLTEHLTQTLLLEDSYYRDGSTKDAAERRAAKEFRTYVADRFYSAFTAPFSNRDDAGRSALHFEPTGIYALSPIGEWVEFKLSEEWRGGEGVRVCPECGALFTANHGNRKYCKRGTCAYKAHKRKSRAP